VLIFGHTGITLGAALALLNSPFSRSYFLSSGEDKIGGHCQSCPRATSVRNHTSRAFQFTTVLENQIDLRLLLIGSVLPDIIDKPIGQFFFADIFNNGRIFCHTLLFLIAITLAGLYFYRIRAATQLLILSFGTFMHLILDQMWLYPQTILWPIYGFVFPKAYLEHWLEKLLHDLCTDPSVYVPELLGLAILVWFTVLLLRRGKIHAFIKNRTL